MQCAASGSGTQATAPCAALPCHRLPHNGKDLIFRAQEAQTVWPVHLLLLPPPAACNKLHCTHSAPANLHRPVLPTWTKRVH